MKTITKIIVPAVMMLLPITALIAQNNQTINEFKQSPKPTENIIDVIVGEQNGGSECDDWDYVYTGEIDRKTKKEKSEIMFKSHINNRTNFTEEQMLEQLMTKARTKYGESYPKFSLRNFKWELEIQNRPDDIFTKNRKEYTYKYSATVVMTDPKAVANEELSKAIDKALSEVREGSRIAIDQIKVVSGMDKEEYQDQVVEILLDKGYKVVAKEYLEKLYEEQKNQQSGIYNEKTTVQENNFSAVGYYLNVKLTETSLRVQVINVSTGEYAGNATVKLE